VLVGCDESTHDFTGVRGDRLDAKKKTYGYRQRDEQARQTFLARVPDPRAPHLVYVDESGMMELSETSP